MSWNAESFYFNFFFPLYFYLFKEGKKNSGSLILSLNSKKNLFHFDSHNILIRAFLLAGLRYGSSVYQNLVSYDDHIGCYRLIPVY